MSEGKKVIIDVDVVIKKWNAANPDKEKLSREALAKSLGVNRQLFTQWKKGELPQAICVINKLVEIGKCSLDEFVIVVKEPINKAAWFNMYDGSSFPIEELKEWIDSVIEGGHKTVKINMFPSENLTQIIST